MSKDYKEILVLLYDKFSDDLIDKGTTALVNTLLEKKTQDRDSGELEEYVNKQSHRVSVPSEESVTSEEEDAAYEAEKPEGRSSVGADEQANYYNADVFEQQTLRGVRQSVVAVMNSGDVAEAVKDLILMAGEVRKFEEAQITVRTDIASRRDIALANIEVQKAALMTYLDKSFDERKENFRALFSVVDDALEKDNMQQLAMSLEGIIKLAESSPFKDLETIEATAAALTNPDHKWDF